MVSVGVLALQGDFAEHVSVMQELGVNTLEVRNAKEFDQIDALIIPGGESTTMARLLDLDEMRESLVRYAKEGMPVWGTCAGMIMLSTWVSDGRPEPLGLMDIKVSRNAFGENCNSTWSFGRQYDCGSEAEFIARNIFSSRTYERLPVARILPRIYSQEKVNLGRFSYCVDRRTYLRRSGSDRPIA